MPDITTMLLTHQTLSYVLLIVLLAGTWQERNRAGMRCWIASIAVSALGQSLRLVSTPVLGELWSYPIGHLSGPLSGALMYLGTVRYLGQPTNARATFGLLGTIALLSLWSIA